LVDAQARDGLARTGSRQGLRIARGAASGVVVVPVVVVGVAVAVAVLVALAMPAAMRAACRAGRVAHGRGNPVLVAGAWAAGRAGTGVTLAGLARAGGGMAVRFHFVPPVGRSRYRHCTPWSYYRVKPNRREDAMKIGELAKAAGTTVETVRYYEKQGLLPAPQRGVNNYRSYGEAHRERLKLIRNCRALDMTHEEIRTILELADRGQGDCEPINEVFDQHIAHVDARIK